MSLPAGWALPEDRISTQARSLTEPKQALTCIGL